MKYDFYLVDSNKNKFSGKDCTLDEISENLKDTIKSVDSRLLSKKNSWKLIVKIAK